MPRQKQNRMTKLCACGKMCSDTGSGQCRECFLKNPHRAQPITDLVKQIARLMYDAYVNQCRKLEIIPTETHYAFYGSAMDLIEAKRRRPDDVWLPRHTPATIRAESIPTAPSCALDWPRRGFVKQQPDKEEGGADE